jgi:hypothetical protein
VLCLKVLFRQISVVRRMPSSGTLRRVTLVRTDVSEELLFIHSVRRLLVTANVFLVHRFMSPL